jgi:hypothetical protein
MVDYEQQANNFDHWAFGYRYSSDVPFRLEEKYVEVCGGKMSILQKKQ